MTELQLREQIMLDAGVISKPYWQGSRVTGLLNRSQDWLQEQLMKQGMKNWLKAGTTALSNATVLSFSVSKGTLPADMLYHYPLVVQESVGALRPARRVEYNNASAIWSNSILIPTSAYPSYFVLDNAIYCFPQGGTLANIVYTRKVTDLVFDDNTTESEIPLGSQPALIERVIGLIRSSENMEQIAQAKIADVDKEIMMKYKLDVVDQMQKVDREATQ